MIAHIVFFEPKPGISRDQRHAFLLAFRQAVSSVPEVRRARIGKASRIGRMPESGDGHLTYSYVAVLEFEDKPGLDRYLEHPSHQSFAKLFWELCLQTTIVDSDLVDLGSDEAVFLV